jgi:hemicentin
MNKLCLHQCLQLSKLYFMRNRFFSMNSVAVPPAIDEANLVDNPRIVVNRTVLLECPVSGTPLPKIKWLKNGEVLKPGPDMKITSSGRHLEIIRAHVTDTGRFTCIASNEAGELRRSFDLEVLG